MRLTAHQPAYIPWLGLFNKIANADIYCIYDDVQYTTKDFVSRNRIKTANGPLWLTVPVFSKGSREKRIHEIEIFSNGWERKHLESIRISYQKAPYFKMYFPRIEEIFMSEKNTSLVQFNTKWLQFGFDVFNLPRKVKFASDLGLAGNKSDSIIDMCLKLQSNEYIFGELGQDYAEFEKFRLAGIKPYFQEMKIIEYPQLYGGFIPKLSFIDALFNVGPQAEVLMRESWILSE